MQVLFEPIQRVGEASGVVVVVVQMHFHVAPAVVTMLRQPSHVLRRVLALVQVRGVKKRVLWSLATHVCKPLHQPRILFHPPSHSILLNGEGRIVPHRLEVIRNAQEHMPRPGRQ